MPDYSSLLANPKLYYSSEFTATRRNGPPAEGFGLFYNWVIIKIKMVIPEEVLFISFSFFLITIKRGLNMFVII